MKQVPHAQYCFEVPGDLRTSILNVADAVEAIRRFVVKGTPWAN